MSVEYVETVLLPRRLIRPNEWNPNVMNAEMFNEVNKNIEELGFVQDVIVAPLTPEEAGETGYEYRIVDGEHRFDALGILGGIELEIDGVMEEVVPCKVVDIPEDSQKFQTVKLNRLRGKMDLKKFNQLVQDLMKRHTFEEVAERMSFTNPDELQSMITSTRDSLPPEMRDAFDKAKGEIRTVDDLSLVLNRLFTQYGDTLPFNFMILDFGGKEHIWVRMEPREHRMIQAKARECMAHGVTFDSVISRVVSVLPVDKFIQGHRDFLKEPDTSQGSKGDIFDQDRNPVETTPPPSPSCQGMRPPMPPPGARRVFIDLGAWVGDTIQGFLGQKKGYFAWMFRTPVRDNFEIHAFDAAPDAAVALQALARTIPNMHVHQCFVGTADGEVEFSTRGKDSSAFRLAEFDPGSKDIITVPQIDFAAWLKSMVTKDYYVVLKIDIEGAEYALLDHLLKHEALDLVQELYIDFHKHKETKTLYDHHFVRISEELKEMKFAVLFFDHMGNKVPYVRINGNELNVPPGKKSERK